MGDQFSAGELKELGVRRWNSKDAGRVLKFWRASGLSMNAFSAQHGLAAQRLSWWKKRLGDWRDGDAGPGLVPAVVLGASALSAPVAIRLPGGVVLEVADPGAVEPAWLAAVVGTLSRSA